MRSHNFLVKFPKYCEGGQDVTDNIIVIHQLHHVFCLHMRHYQNTCGGDIRQKKLSIYDKVYRNLLVIVPEN